MSEFIRTSVEAQSIIGKIVDKYEAALNEGAFPNPLRAIDKCAREASQALTERGLPLLLVSTLGDVDPMTFGFCGDGKPDYFEKDLLLADSLALDPEGPTYYRLGEATREIKTKCKKRGVPGTRYDIEAKGTREARNLIREEMVAIGLNTDSEQQVWMTHGGMEALGRAFRTLHNFFERKKGKEAVLWSPSVCFTVATNAAFDNGLIVEYIPTSDLPHQEITAERIQTFLDGGAETPDIMLITPADNPRACSYNAENLRQILLKMKEINPEIVFIFDMAYMSMIPPEKAKALIAVIQETGVDQRAIFAISESKRLARPGTRIGAAVIFNEELKKVFQADTIRNYPGFSGEVDVLFRALSYIIPPETIAAYISMLRQRQQTLLEVLRDLDPEGEYFKNLGLISVPGYSKINTEALEQDVPLYLWVELQEGVSPFEIIKKLGIAGVPGSVFGDTGNHMRFSLGVVSTADILRKSPKTLARWGQDLVRSLTTNLESATQ